MFFKLTNKKAENRARLKQCWGLGVGEGLSNGFHKWSFFPPNQPHSYDTVLGSEREIRMKRVAGSEDYPPCGF